MWPGGKGGTAVGEGARAHLRLCAAFMLMPMLGGDFCEIMNYK